MALLGSGRSAAGSQCADRMSLIVSNRFLLSIAVSLTLVVSGAVAAGAGTSVTPAPAVAPVKTQAKAAIVNPSWKELKPAQQQALSPLVAEWDKLDANHKSKWLEIARKFETMKPDEQIRIQERMRAWVALTPDQRRVARESYARTKKLNTDQKSAQWEQYQQLPDEQKKKLAAEAAKNKVASLPPTHSKPKTVPPIKSVQKPILQQSIMPRTAAIAPSVGGIAPGAPAAAAGSMTVLPTVPAAPAAPAVPVTPAVQVAPPPAPPPVTSPSATAIER